MFRTKITRSPEFLEWLETQKENPEYDYKSTRYYREKKTSKDRDRFLKISVTILAIIYFVLLLVFVIQ